MNEVRNMFQLILNVLEPIYGVSHYLLRRRIQGHDISEQIFQKNLVGGELIRASRLLLDVVFHKHSENCNSIIVSLSIRC